LSNELNVKQIDLSLENLDDYDKDLTISKVAGVVSKPATFKEHSHLVDLAKKHHMTTDIKKQIFQAIVSSDDFQ